MKESLKLGTTEAEFLIQSFMKENSILVDDDGEVLYTWKSSKPKEVVDYEAVCAMMCNMYGSKKYHEYVAIHTTTKPGSRRFLNKIKMEED